MFWVRIVKNGCGQSVHGILRLTVSWKLNGVDFLHASSNSGKLKVDSMIFGRVWSKMVMAC